MKHDPNYHKNEIERKFLEFVNNFSKGGYLLPIVFIVGIGVYSSFYTVEPDEEAVIIRLGKYTTTESIEKLSQLGSSNCVENMNQQIARKAPKALHFSESESLDFRVSAAVLQKNEGHSYICEVILIVIKYTVALQL